MDDIESPDRSVMLGAIARVEQDSTSITDTDMRYLAESLLSIARTAMPSTFYAADSRCRLAHAVRAGAVKRAETAYWDDTCGDCVEGRCHWGGETSRRSIELAGGGGEYEDPQFGTCGCSRHATSVLARGYERKTFQATVLAWQEAKDLGQVVTREDEAGTIWISRPPAGLNGDLA